MRSYTKNGILIITDTVLEEMKQGCNSRELSTPRTSTPYPYEKEKGDALANLPE